MFEWQKHSQSHTEVPDYQHILEFIDLRAQASEASLSEANGAKKHHRRSQPDKVLSSFFSAKDSSADSCVLCKNEKHLCPKFKSLTNDGKLATLKSHNRCLNCLRSGHIAKHCKSLHHCRKCQKPHHTLLHVDTPVATKSTSNQPVTVVNNAAATVSRGLSCQTLLMTCHVQVHEPYGSSHTCRTLLDSASSTSFISERLTQSLGLPRRRLHAKIMGIAGITHDLTSQYYTNLTISPVNNVQSEIQTQAVIMPQVTCNLPVQSVPFNPDWVHLSDITLADPDFGQPDQIDLLLGVNVFVQVMRQGLQQGPARTPYAFETEFGWVLAGGTNDSLSLSSLVTVIMHHTTVDNGDQILRRFWGSRGTTNQRF